MSAKTLLFCAVGLVAACGDDGGGAPDSGVPRCDAPPGPFATGDANGHAAPLGASVTEARAGRLTQAMIDAAGGSPMLTWAAGDYVLANDHVALVIEDAGPSDLYDPWGGRPVAVAQVAGGALVAPALFGEVFLLTGKSSVVTTRVTVMNDGSDGGPAVVRATGRLAPLPFLANLLGGLYFDGLTDVEAAIDYTLAPGADDVAITIHYGSPRGVAFDTGAILHGFMYTDRMPVEIPGRGFTSSINGAAWVQLVDDRATSWAYRAPDDTMGSSLAESGFVGAFTAPFTVAACGVTDEHHADLLIGGPGLDGLEVARARVEGRALRAITGTVTDGDGPIAGAHVHATLADGTYLTRATTDAAGAYALHVPDGEAVTLTAYRRGWQVATADVPAATATADLALPTSGAIHIHVEDASGPVPARVQLFPAGASAIPSVPDAYGERAATDGRLDVEFPTDGEIVIPVPAGAWRVVVSRGYEYDLVDTTVDVTASQTTDVSATLHRVVDTTGVQCGDFHVHTHRSNDSGDDATEKVRSAVADGVELPVRTDHEWVGTFQPIIEALGVQAWAFGIGSIEMTSFQFWGHMGVFPLTADPTKPNAGAPTWQEWPTAASPDTPVRTLSPPEVFAQVRARPEAPTIIINHPRGNTDYFGYAGYDAATGTAARPSVWDDEFTLVEVFNDSGWQHNRGGTVTDWFSLLDHGRRVFAVGSSDSHGITSSPVGYPRTCIALGTDDPRQLDADTVRNELVAGHATISGGIYVDTTVGAAHPGDTATGVGATAHVDVRVQAATWVDVDALDVVVDGVTVQTLAIAPGDADPANPVVRWRGTIDVPVAAAGSWVVVAAYGDAALEPVHPGRLPFGVTNPIFLGR